MGCRCWLPTSVGPKFNEGGWERGSSKRLPHAAKTFPLPSTAHLFATAGIEQNIDGGVGRDAAIDRENLLHSPRKPASVT